MTIIRKKQTHKYTEQTSYQQENGSGEGQDKSKWLRGTCIMYKINKL